MNIDKKRVNFRICYQNEYNKLIIDYILILKRLYIYKCRINNKELNIAAGAKYIKFFINIEKKIAIKTDHFDKCKKKHWQKWMQIFEDSLTLSVFLCFNVIIKRKRRSCGT